MHRALAMLAGMLAVTADGFNAVVALDNGASLQFATLDLLRGNVYGVMLSEMISNIFKEGMWFKALTPYMLIITDNAALLQRSAKSFCCGTQLGPYCGGQHDDAEWPYTCSGRWDLQKCFEL